MKLTIFLTAMCLFMIGCGKGGSDGSATPSATNILPPKQAPATPVAAAPTPQQGQVCGANMIQSQFGCAEQCGIEMVMNDGHCVPVDGSPLLPWEDGTSIAACQGTCGPGFVSVQGGQACLPQLACGPCYGQGGPDGNSCYLGDDADKYYSY